MAGEPDNPGANDAAGILSGTGISEEEFTAARSRMIGLVKRVCPRWLADQSEDIVQTALVQVIDRTSSGKENLKIGPSYLMKAAYNVTVDEIRKRFRRVDTVEADHSILDTNPSSEPHPEKEAVSADISRGIRECLLCLTRPRRSAVTLHLLGYSHADAARFLGWSRKRTEHLIYRGLGDLRRCLDAKGLRPS